MRERKRKEEKVLSEVGWGGGGHKAGGKEIGDTGGGKRTLVKGWVLEHCVMEPIQEQLSNSLSHGD